MPGDDYVVSAAVVNTAAALAEQATWYAGVSNLFGLPLHVPHS